MFCFTTINHELSKFGGRYWFWLHDKNVSNECVNAIHIHNWKPLKKKKWWYLRKIKNTQKLPTDLLQYISTIQKINNNKYLCLYNRFFNNTYFCYWIKNGLWMFLFRISRFLFFVRYFLCRFMWYFVSGTDNMENWNKNLCWLFLLKKTRKVVKENLK